jgi:hypothetical protein
MPWPTPHLARQSIRGATNRRNDAASMRRLAPVLSMSNAGKAIEVRWRNIAKNPRTADK